MSYKCPHCHKLIEKDALIEAPAKTSDWQLNAALLIIGLAILYGIAFALGYL